MLSELCFYLAFGMALGAASWSGVYSRRSVRIGNALETQQSNNAIDVFMPGAYIDSGEQYLCTSVPVPRAAYAVGFAPKVAAGRAHHMLVYGCTMPEHFGGVHQCWEHASCKSGPVTLFAWGRNAPALNFPKGVGVAVGPGISTINHIVMQIHYVARPIPDATLDYSGLRILLSDQKPQYFAGVYGVIQPSGYIPAKTTGFAFNLSCPITATEPIFAFAFRVHSHGIGRVVSGYKSAGPGKWLLIGKSNPQWPQAFYPVPGRLVQINPRDDVAFQCVYDNYNSTPVWIGRYSSNEMCNFYVYYASKSPDAFSGASKWCAGGGPRTFADYPPDAGEPMPRNIALEQAGRQR